MRRSVLLAFALTLAACTSTAATTPGPGSPWRLAYSGYGQASVSTQAGRTRITLDAHDHLVGNQRGVAVVIVVE